MTTNVRDEPLLGPSDLHNLPPLPRAALRPVPRRHWPVVALVGLACVLVGWLK